MLFHKNKNYLSFRPETQYRARNIQLFTEEGDRYIQAKELPGNSPTAIFLPTIIPTNNDFKIRSMFDEIIYCANSSQVMRRHKARILLMELLLELAARAQHSRKNVNPPIDYIVTLIEENITTRYAIDELAEIINFGRTSLIQQFKANTGLSIKQFYIRQKIKSALSIIENDRSVTSKELAGILKFSDQYHFCKTFKKVTGLSLSAYRRRLQTQRQGDVLSKYQTSF